MPLRDEIDGRFADNLDRVSKLVRMYEAGASPGKGRRPVQDADLLRAAVVLLHATLEDLLRSLAEWKLPAAAAEALADIPLAGTDGKTRFGMRDLASFRGQTVDSVIARSVDEYLGRANYNHPGDVRRVLEVLDLDPRSVDPHARTLAAMMARRHWIAHRADRNELSGPGHHRARSISLATVKSWVGAVGVFGQSILSGL